MKTKDAVLTLFIVTIALYCSATLHAQQSCVRYVSCGSYSLWWAACLPALPAGAYDCVNAGPFTAECKVNICLPPCPYCDAQASNPIHLATGDTYITETDVRVPGLGGRLTLSRTWNSIDNSGGFFGIGMFGSGWTSNFEESIFVDTGNFVTYLRGDGGVWRFTFSSWDANGNPYFIVGAPASQTAQLTETVLQAQPNWTLAFQNGEKRVFDYFSGKLLSITDRNGNTTQLTYDASYRLVKVTDPASRHLYFSYGSPLSIYGGELGILTYYLVANVTSDFGVSLSYAYDAAGRLTQVTEPDNTTLSFQFSQINEPSPMLPINSLVVLDSNGKVLESHTYNCNGQGLTSSRAGGVEAVTISYPPCYPLYVAADAGTKR